MTTRKEMSRINKLKEIIQNEGKISRVNLIMKARISISYYDKLKPFLEEIYQDFVRYDKDEKMWVAIKNEPAKA